MFLKQRNVSHNQRTQDEQGTYLLVSPNGLLGPPKLGNFILILKYLEIVFQSVEAFQPPRSFPQQPLPRLLSLVTWAKPWGPMGDLQELTRLLATTLPQDMVLGVEAQGNLKSRDLEEKVN